MSGPAHHAELRLREAYDSGSTAPRSTDASLSEDVFTEPELSPIREEQPSTQQLKSEDQSSSESVHTVRHDPEEEAKEKDKDEVKTEGDAGGETASTSEEPKCQEQLSTQTSKDQHEHQPQDTPSQSSTATAGTDQERDPDEAKSTRDSKRDSETDVEELRKMWKSHTMQQAKEQRENAQHTQKETASGKGNQRQGSAEGKTSCYVTVESPISTRSGFDYFTRLLHIMYKTIVDSVALLGFYGAEPSVQEMYINYKHI